MYTCVSIYVDVVDGIVKLVVSVLSVASQLERPSCTTIGRA